MPSLRSSAASRALLAAEAALSSPPPTAELAAPAPAEDEDDPMLVGALAIAREIGVAVRVARHWIYTGDLPVFKVGRHCCLYRSTARELRQRRKLEGIARAAERRAAMAAEKEAEAAAAARRPHKKKGAVPRPRRGQWGIDSTVAAAILQELDRGLPGSILFSNHEFAGKRAARHVVQHHLPDASDDKARQIVAGWLAAGLLEEVDFRTPRGWQKGLKLKRTGDESG
jgi:hypothetical protein